MTDHKFTDDDVIKALRELQEMSEFTPPICHYEKDITEPPFCKPFEQFQNDAKVALALINRQKAKIERLQADIDGACVLLEEQHKRREQEHKTQMELLNQIQERIPLAIARAKSEAIKEFAERAKEKMNNLSRMEYNFTPYFLVSKSFIDNLVKEMTEVDNG